jgi:hypothetical protein
MRLGNGESGAGGEGGEVGKVGDGVSARVAFGFRGQSFAACASEPAVDVRGVRRA